MEHSSLPRAQQLFTGHERAEANARRHSSTCASSAVGEQEMITQQVQNQNPIPIDVWPSVGAQAPAMTLQPTEVGVFSGPPGTVFVCRDPTGEERCRFALHANPQPMLSIKARLTSAETRMCIGDSQFGYSPSAAARRAFPSLLSEGEEDSLGMGDLPHSYRRNPLPLVLAKLQALGPAAKFTDAHFPPVAATLADAKHFSADWRAFRFMRLVDLAEATKAQDVVNRPSTLTDFVTEAARDTKGTLKSAASNLVQLVLNPLGLAIKTIRETDRGRSNIPDAAQADEHVRLSTPAPGYPASMGPGSVAPAFGPLQSLGSCPHRSRPCGGGGGGCQPNVAPPSASPGWSAQPQQSHQPSSFRNGNQYDSATHNHHLSARGHNEPVSVDAQGLRLVSDLSWEEVFTLTVHNDLGAIMRVHWLDGTGAPQWHADIASRATFQCDCVRGHAWTFHGSDGGPGRYFARKHQGAQAVEVKASQLPQQIGLVPTNHVPAGALPPNNAGQSVAAPPPLSTVPRSQRTVSLFGPDGPRPVDIVQGGIGNCWMVQVLAAAVTRPDALRGCFATASADPELEAECMRRGVFALRFTSGDPAFFGGNQKESWVLIDDFVPTRDGGLLSEPKSVLCPPREGKLWVSLLEKAIAKMKRGYGNLHAEGRNKTVGVGRIHVMIGGGKHSTLNWDPANPAAPSDLQHFRKVQALLRAPKASFVSLSSARDPAIQLRGLVPYHGYAVLEVFELDPVTGADWQECQARRTGGSPLRLLKLANTWEKGAWNGEWMFRCPRWAQFPAVRQRLARPGWDDSSVFVMSYEDFKRYFCVIWFNHF
jgi:hypothetical protein